MAAALIAISFICAILIAVFIPVKRIYSDIPSLAIVLWLALANLMHGINSALFDGTVSVQSFVWCDISTKLLLGVNVAIPGAFICIGRRMELVASSRKMLESATVKRNMMIFEVLLCYVLPVIYMSLHLLAQHHRFDIIEDFGCFAAVHPSTPGVILVWILPLAIGGISLILSSLALKHSLSLPKAAFAKHLDERSTTISSSLFIRRVATAIAMSCISIITTLFSLFSVPRLVPWKSWDHAHAEMGRAVILAPGEISNTRLRWWFILAFSVAHILLSFAFGEETRDALKWIRAMYLRRHEFGPWLQDLLTPPQRLPRHQPRSKPSSPTGSLPHMVDLRSGWDDTIDLRPSATKSMWLRGNKSSRSDTASPVSSRSPSSASMRGEQHSTGGPMTNEDRVFMDSTISYLGSPPAQALGISSPPRNSPSPIRFASPSPALIAPAVRRPLSIVIADPVLPHMDEVPARAMPMRSPVASRPAQTNISAVIRADWPVPPQTPSPVGSMSSRYSRARSPEHSPSSSIEEMADYISHGTPTTPIHTSSHSRPFEGSYACYNVSLGNLQPTPKIQAGRSPSLKQSIQSLRDSWNRDRQRHASAQSQQDGIIMTVVQETV